jgi:uncharacterized protein (DUF488 family)
VSDLNTLYTIGYTGLKPERLRAIVAQHNAVLWDIRYSPNSRHPQWRRDALKALLGDAYVHIPALGNRNYKGGPIELAAPAQALDQARLTLQRQPIILMCACKDYWTCHRDDAADYLDSALELDVEHL